MASLSRSLVCLDDVAAAPWRNGGGSTRELLACPVGVDWALRVSVAEIEADGPFSSFPGTARWFAVLEGNGVVLTIDGSEHLCTIDGPAQAFAGAAETHCRLVDGPTRDLNLMLRGGGAAGALLRVAEGAAWSPGALECGLYATSAGNCYATASDGSDDGDAGETIPARSLRWWNPAPATLRFEGSGWWLAVGTVAAA